jgi:hypothetical protein
LNNGYRNPAIIKGPDGPLISVYEEKLGSLIGILSEFIVERKYAEIMKNGKDRLDLSSALDMSKGIMDEVSVLVGPARAYTLSKEFEKITEEFFKEEE